MKKENLTAEEYQKILIKMLKEKKVEEVKNILNQRSIVVTSCVIICHASFVSLDHNVPIISKTKTEEMQIAGMIFLEKPLKLSFHKTKHKNIPIIIKPLATLATKGE